MAEVLRLVVADDSGPFREGLTALLATVDDVEVIGEASTGEEAVSSAAALQPDVVVMDVNMPGEGGVEATRRIVAASPHIAVLVLTMHEDEDTVFAAMRAGARGYLVKGARQAELLRAIRAIADGGAVFGPSVARRLVDFFSASQTAAADTTFEDLTPREREILGLIAEGRSNAQIAEQLVLSRKTVRNHVSNVFGKLSVADRSEAIVRARRAGLGEPD